MREPRTSARGGARDLVEVEAGRRQKQVGIERAVADDPPDEREAVRMDPRRGEADHRVPGLDPRPVHHAVAVDDTDRRAAEVELVLAIDAGKLRRLTAEDRAAGGATDVGGALDQLRDLLDVDRVGGDVVEEEERLGSGGEDVVDAVGGEVGAAPAQPAPRRPSTSFDPTESVEAASSRRSSIAKRPAKAPKAPATPGVAVEATAVRRRSTIASAVASETPAAA